MTLYRRQRGSTEYRSWTYWAAEWRHVNRPDGDTSHLLHEDLFPKLFKTRRECRAWIEEKFGYIRDRPDLRAEPHGWRMPRPVLITVEPCR